MRNFFVPHLFIKYFFVPPVVCLLSTLLPSALWAAKFFGLQTLWSYQNVFGPPTAGCAVVDFKDRALYIERELLGQLKSIHLCGNFCILYAPFWCYMNALSTSFGNLMMNSQKYTNLPIIMQYISHIHITHAHITQQLTLIWHVQRFHSRLWH